MDGEVKKMKAKVGNIRVEMSVDNTEWKFNTFLSADDTILLAESKNDLCTNIDKMNSVFVREEYSKLM